MPASCLTLPGTLGPHRHPGKVLGGFVAKSGSNSLPAGGELGALLGLFWDPAR